MAAAFAACILLLPAAFMLRNEADRRTLNHATNAVFSPNYAATRIPIRGAPLRRALDRMDDMKHGIYLPYLSDIYNTMVFHGMVLPDEKAKLIQQCLLGAVRDEKSRAGIWENGFFGGRRRNERRIRGGGVSHQVVVASHAEERRQTNGVAEVEVRFELENRGGANGEFSERIALPEGVLVTGFWLDVNGVHKPAQFRERKTATWVYEMIRDMTRRDPGLLVYEDDRRLRLRVYPFAAGEKRNCGMRFRFPTALQPSIEFADSAIALSGAATETPPPMAVCAAMTNGASALAIPTKAAAGWPSFRREVAAYLILDRSACAGTNRAAVVARARSALANLPSSIKLVHITWANYEQEDLPGEPMSREAATRALDRLPSIPFRGGFCPERVIARVLLADSRARAPRIPQPSGFAPLFVVIPAPGSTPLYADGLASFARLAPDLPAYAVFDGNRLERIAFDHAARNIVQFSDFIPADAVAIRNGEISTIVVAHSDSLAFAPGAASGWQLWNPVSGNFETMAGLTTCTDRSYLAGLALWSRHRALNCAPDKLDAALPELVKDTREAGVLIPEAALIVVETKAQEVMLSRKERQSLAANNALEFDEAKSEKAPAPPVVWLIVPVIWLLWRKQSARTIFQRF